jgi:hypothetical protein
MERYETQFSANGVVEALVTFTVPLAPLQSTSRDHSQFSHSCPVFGEFIVSVSLFVGMDWRLSLHSLSPFLSMSNASLSKLLEHFFCERLYR